MPPSNSLNNGRREGEAAEPHVLFLGLAFLSQLQLTVDLDAMRMSAVEAPATPGSAESFGVRRWWSQRP